MKKRILFITDGLVVGGIEKALLNILKYIDRNKFDVELLLEYRGDKWECKVPSDITVTDILGERSKPRSKLFNRLYIYFLRYMPGIVIQKTFINKQYDLIIAFRKDVLYYIKGSKCNTMIWDHSDFSQYNKKIFDKSNEYKKDYKERINDYLIYKVYEKCNKIVCVNKKTKELFSEVFKSDKIECVYNLNDNIEIQKMSEEQMGGMVNKNKFIISTVGRIAEEKGQFNLVRACKKLYDDGLEFELWIIGSGQEEEKKIKAYIIENKLTSTIKMFGSQNNPYKYIKHSDLYVCPSSYESYGLTIAEAIILNVPILATNCTGPAELLEYGKYGMLVENDSDSLALGIKEFIECSEILDLYKKKSIERSKLFELESNIKMIENFLIEIIHNKNKKYS